MQKTVKLTVLFLFFPFVFWGQKQLTGLWIGSLSNDSTTIRKEQSFEVALTEYRGKVYGYSRSEFIINDTLYYILKRVKGTIQGDSCEVKDDEILSYNFRGRLDKGVKVITTFHMNKQDSTWHLDGTWRTNKTKRFYSITGGIKLKEEKDLSQSKIFPHLEELNLAKDVAFYKEEKKQNELTIKTQQDNSKAESLARAIIKKEMPANVNKQDIAINDQDIKKKIQDQSLSEQTVDSVKLSPRNKENPVVVNKIDTKPQMPSNVTKREVAINEKEIIKKIQDQSLAEQSTDSVKLAPKNKENPIAINKSRITKTNPSETNNLAIPNKPAIVNNGPAALVLERSFYFSPPVSFKSDSLELSLYDNGEIDGDTVSVLLNGKIIIAKEGLKATAIKRTVYITPDMGDSIILVLYAENLGKYPPNTGLMVIHDGDDAYQVRFSADLQTNAAVILRRKK
jgi:hypothetical protein